VDDPTGVVLKAEYLPALTNAQGMNRTATPTLNSSYFTRAASQCNDLGRLASLLLTDPKRGVGAIIMFFGKFVALAILLANSASGFRTDDSTPGVTQAVSAMHIIKDPDVKCLSYAVESGNPDTGPSTHILRFPKGCAYPWHYHTAEEQVNGSSRIGLRSDG
jgi:hypothetical protein